MRVVKPQGDASQEGYRGRLEVSPTGSIPCRENPAWQVTNDKVEASRAMLRFGQKHQREYGHGHASPDRRVETSSDQNQISRTKVHGPRGRRRRWHDKFRLRFRLVSPDGKSGAPIQHRRIKCLPGRRGGLVSTLVDGPLFFRSPSARERILRHPALPRIELARRRPAVLRASLARSPR